MILAIPEYRGRVAPVFDSCTHIVVFLLKAQEEDLLVDEDWSGRPRLTRAGRLKELMVELLVCGGITCCLEDQIRQYGIELIPWVAGELPDIMEAIRNGRIFDPCYSMPGRIGCRRVRFHGRLRRDSVGQNAEGKECHHARI